MAATQVGLHSNDDKFLTQFYGESVMDIVVLCVT